MKKQALMVFLSLLIAGILQAQGLMDSLIVYYSFSGTAFDQSGNGLHATLDGPVFAADRMGNPGSACYFDGLNDQISLPLDARLKPAMPFTIAFWVLPETLLQSDCGFLSTDAQDNNYAGCWIITHAVQAGSIELSIGGNLGMSGSQYRRTKTSAVPLVSGQWNYLVCVVRGATDMDIYLNGTNAGGTYSGTGPSSIGYSNNPGKIGHLNSGSFFWGTIDEFAMWNRALTATDVANIWTGGLGIHSPEQPVSSIVKRIYPNPAGGKVCFELDNPLGSTVQFGLYGIGGNLIYQEQVVSNTFFLEKALPAGLYYYRFTDGGTGMQQSGKLALE